MPSGIIAIVKRDRSIVLAALAALTVLAWAYVLWLAMQMSASADMASMDMGDMDMAGMDMRAMLSPGFADWTPVHFLLTFAMWAIMMVGMMTPSVAPMILIYTQVARQAETSSRPFAPVGWFAGGYLSAWTLFALAATVAQYAFERAALLSPMLVGTSTTLGGIFLIVAGLYQWSALKTTCLSQCRAPLSFVQRHGGFKPTRYGSLRLDALHGAYCVGCCWPLMALLFVGGVMNLLWIAGLTIFVLLEKIVPKGQILSRAAGLVLLAAGGWMLVA